MSSVINTSTSPKLLWPGQKGIWRNFYDQHSEEYSQYMTVVQSDKKFEEYTGNIGFGLMPIKEEGAPLLMDTEAQGFTQRYTNVAYSLGYSVTYEEMEDNLYMKVTSNRMPALARSMKQTIETVDANHLNRGFNSSFTGSDGVELFSLVHPNTTGGTYSNELTTPADLSEASIEDLCIQIDQTQDDRGLQTLIRPELLVVHPNDRFTACRILKSEFQNDTGNNAINALMSLGYFSKGYLVSHFVTDTDAWFITTDVQYGLTHLERTAPRIDEDNDFQTKNMLVSGYVRFSSAWTDPLGAFASEGAA